MSVQPKIFTKDEINTLRLNYIDNNKSTVDIERESYVLFGKYVSRGTIYKSLIRNGIPIRNKSISVSRAMSTLDIDSSFENESVMEWVDGLMLGDGFINFKRKTNYQNARYIIGTSSKQWAVYAMSKLSDYDPCEPVVYQKIDIKHPNLIWESKTKTHPDIVVQANRWYCGENESKIVPQDVKITPTSVMLWYLGDGSFTYQNNGNIAQLRLATCSFSEYELNILRDKLLKHKIRTTIYKSKMDIHVCSDSIRDFFNFIGWQSPFDDYDHKFNIPDWLKLYRLSDITTDQREKWRIQKWCKEGKVEHSRSPGGKMLLFTKEQKDIIRNIIS